MMGKPFVRPALMRAPQPLPGVPAPLFQQAPHSAPHAAIHPRKRGGLAVLEVSIELNRSAVA